MALRLIERIAEPNGGYPWQPFPPTPGYRADWWTGVRTPANRNIYLSALAGEAEVARIELDPVTHLSSYRDIPPITKTPLRIQFIEVSLRLRHRGVGRSVIDLLTSRYRSNSFVALASDDAVGFWESLGWTRHLHFEDSDTRPLHWPLYLQPAD